MRPLPKIGNGEVIVEPPASSQPQPKRSKKGKKKHQGQASAADYLKVTPLSREADLLREGAAPSILIYLAIPRPAVCDRPA